jgi:Lamin Tail Domain
MYDPDTLVDTLGEWFELYNRGTTTVNLKNWNFKDPSNSVQTFNITTDLFIGPGQYRVIGASASTALNGNVTLDFAYGVLIFFLANDADAIIMTDSNGTERDRVIYSSSNSFPDASGGSISLKSPGLDNSVGANWCKSGTVWLGSTANDFGTPGAANVCQIPAPTKAPVTKAPVKAPTKTPTKAPVSKAPVKAPTKAPIPAPMAPVTPPVNPNSLIVINEIMYDPDVPNDTPGEWFELFNRGTTTVNLKNWNFKDQSNTVQTFNITTDLLIGPGQFKVIGANSNTATNGNVAVDFAYGTSVFFLANNAVDAIIMSDSDGVERDRVVYGGNTFPGNTFPDASGGSISLKSLGLDNSLGSNWCISNTVWLGSTQNDFGTPGAPNVCPA